MEEKEVIQNRITNLINLRQTMIQALIVLIGGIAGVCFMSNSIEKYVALILGVFGICIIIKIIHEQQKEIRGYLYKNEGDNYIGNHL